MRVSCLLVESTMGLARLPREWGKKLHLGENEGGHGGRRLRVCFHVGPSPTTVVVRNSGLEVFACS